MNKFQACLSGLVVAAIAPGVAQAQSVGNFNLSQDAFQGSGTVTCTVTFPLHLNALTLKVTSSSPSVVVPNAIIVPKLAKSVTFNASITASGGGRALPI